MKLILALGLYAFATFTLATLAMNLPVVYVAFAFVAGLIVTNFVHVLTYPSPWDNTPAKYWRTARIFFLWGCCIAVLGGLIFQLNPLDPALFAAIIKWSIYGLFAITTIGYMSEVYLGWYEGREHP